MNSVDAQKLREILVDIPDEIRARVVSFYQLLANENQKQNLTRLISPEDFRNGHLVDVLELLKSQMLEYPAVDLGSGCGVPGLLAAVVEPREWVLVESEKRKAEFLERATQELNLKPFVTVRAERLESYLKAQSTNAIVARAVGSVEKIYAWIIKCSTWNNLILFKGPGWDEEWSRFQQSRFRDDLRVSSIHSYTIDASSRERKIIKLERTKS